jgi:hypothetical protein
MRRLNRENSIDYRSNGCRFFDALGDGFERQIIFEGGAPVATNSADTLSFEKVGDLFLIRVGDERFEVPGAAVTGG